MSSNSYEGPSPSHSNASPDSTVSISICPICCEEDLTASPTSAVVLSSCLHGSCRMCLARWIDREEASGRTSGPTCPFCRLAIGEEDVLKILDRPFQPREATAGETPIDEVDEFTLHWINENTVPCGMCGYRVEKSDGCDLIECLCGFRFCYRCGAADGRCRCNPGHGFLGEQFYVGDAPVRDVNGRVDLKLCIRRREVRQERRNKLEANWAEELAHWQYSSKNPRLCTFNGRWLFSSKVSTRCIAMLTQQLEQATVNRERDNERLENRHYERRCFEVWESCYIVYNSFRARYEHTLQQLENGRISNQGQKKLKRMSGVLKQMEKALFRGFGVWYILYEVAHWYLWQEDLKRYDMDIQATALSWKRKKELLTCSKG
jgi:hypothetical protein